MEHIFYGLALFAFIWELLVLTQAKKIKEFLDDKEHESRNVFGCLMFLYIAWTFLGLFSSQWVWFLAIIVLSMIPKGKIIWLKRVDALITIGLLIGLVITKYH